MTMLLDDGEGIQHVQTCLPGRISRSGQAMTIEDEEEAHGHAMASRKVLLHSTRCIHSIPYWVTHRSFDSIDGSAEPPARAPSAIWEPSRRVESATWRRYHAHYQVRPGQVSDDYKYEYLAGRRAVVV